MAHARKILGEEDLRSFYPNVDLTGFVPTHLISVFDAASNRLIRQDLVSLSDIVEECGVQYATRADQESPVYARIPPNLWQCLEHYGLLKVQEICYKPAYLPKHKKQGKVYFIQSQGPSKPIKIGWSQNVERRLSELQTSNAHKLVILGVLSGTMELEEQMHKKFAHLRLEAEWFQNDDQIHRFLQEKGIQWRTRI